MYKNIREIKKLETIENIYNVLDEGLVKQISILLLCENIKHLSIYSSNQSDNHKKYITEFLETNREVKKISTIKMNNITFSLKGFISNKTKFIITEIDNETFLIINNKLL